jgi:hypothetical protein
MVALHYLKYTHNLSDTDVVQAWVENPYYQHFSGMKYFEHKMPIHPSSMSRWRKRIGDAGAEQLLQETIEAGLKLKAVKSFMLKRINVDTTVQEKEVRLPTDARLYDRARQRLVEAAKTRDIDIRQNYNRKSKHLIAQQSRYALSLLLLWPACFQIHPFYGSVWSMNLPAGPFLIERSGYRDYWSLFLLFVRTSFSSELDIATLLL